MQLDGATSPWNNYWMFNRYLLLRLEFLTASAVLIATILIILEGHDNGTAGKKFLLARVSFDLTRSCVQESLSPALCPLLTVPTGHADTWLSSVWVRMILS